jgi:hypothetical protein
MDHWMTLTLGRVGTYVGQSSWINNFMLPCTRVDHGIGSPF